MGVGGVFYFFFAPVQDPAMRVMGTMLSWIVQGVGIIVIKLIELINKIGGDK